MIQAKRLECGFKGVVQMKSKDDKQNNINNRIRLVSKEIKCHAVKIMVIRNSCRTFRRACYSQLDKIEIHHMNDKKDADHNACMYHELGEERSMRPSFLLVPDGPGHPVLDLQDDAENNMDDKSSKKDYLHNLYQGVCTHEVGSLTEYLLMVFSDWQNKKIDAQVHDQEYHQEGPRESHDEFFG